MWAVIVRVATIFFWFGFALWLAHIGIPYLVLILIICAVIIGISSL